MPPAHPVHPDVHSSDDDLSDAPLTNDLSSAKRSRPVSLPITDKPNVWKRCLLPPGGDQIRLLKLYPPGRHSDNVLEANLVVRQGNEPYEALSYTWGSEGDTGSIRVWPGSGEFEEIDDHRSGKIVIQLNGRLNKCGVISPRFNIRLPDLEKWVNQLLPARSIGYVVLTTSAGIMDHEEARRKHVAGKILGFFY